MIAPLVYLLRSVLARPTIRVAGQESDPAAAVWLASEVARDARNMVGTFVSSSVAYPNGLTVPWELRLPSIAVELPASLLGRITGAPFAYNLVLICLIVTTAISYRRLCVALNLSVPASILSFQLLALSPFFVTEVQLHLPLIALAPLLELIRLTHTANFCSKFVRWKAGLLVGLQFYIHPYLPLYAVAVFTVVLIIRRVRHRSPVSVLVHQLCTPILIGAGMASPVLLGFLLIQTSDLQVTRASSDLDAFSSTLLEQYNSIPGSFFAVALIAVLLAALNRDLRKGLRLPALLIVLGSALSLPRDYSIGPWRLPSLSGLIFDTFSIHRVASRAMMLLWLGMALLVANSYTFATRRWQINKPVFALFTLAIMWQTGAIQSFSYFEIRDRPALRNLLTSNGALVADFPLSKFDAAIGPALSRQIGHHGTLLNGGPPNTTNLILMLIAERSFNEESPYSLQAIGVTDVISERRADLPASVRKSAQKIDGLWHAHIPRIKGVAQTWWDSSLGDEGGSFWLAGDTSVTVSASSPGSYSVRFSISTPGNTTDLVLPDLTRIVLTGKPRSVETCAVASVITHLAAPAIAVLRLNFVDEAVQLSQVDLRRAVARITNVQVVPGCK